MSTTRAIDQAISDKGHKNTEVAEWLLQQLKQRKLKLSKPHTLKSLAVMIGYLRSGERLAFWNKNREPAQLLADRYGVAIEDLLEGSPAPENSILLPEFPALAPVNVADGPCALWASGWLLDLAIGVLRGEGERRWIVAPAGWGKSLLVKWTNAVHGGATKGASAQTLTVGAAHRDSKVPLVLEIEEVGPGDKAALRALAGRKPSTIVLAPFHPPSGPPEEIGSWAVQTLPESPGWRSRLLAWICDRLEREGRDTKLDAIEVQAWLDRYDPNGSLVASPGDLLALCADIDRESIEGDLGDRAHRWLACFAFRSLGGAGREWGDRVGATAFSEAVVGRFASLTQPPGPTDAEAWARALPDRTAPARAGNDPGALVAVSYLREAGLLRGEAEGLVPFPRWVQQGLLERMLETEFAAESREAWGAFAADASRAVVVDRALDALDDERLCRLVRKVATQGPPETLASTAAVEATFAAASRRLASNYFAVPADELSAWHEVARLQARALVPCAGYWTGLHHPFTRRGLAGWLVDAWRFSFRLAAPTSPLDRALAWELPGWFETLELGLAPNLPLPSSFVGLEKELAPLLDALAQRIGVTTVPKGACPLLAPAFLLAPAGQEWGLDGTHLEFLASAWARTVGNRAWSLLLDSFPADRWPVAARRTWHLCPSAMKQPGANFRSLGVADRIAYLTASHPSLLHRIVSRLEWADVEAAVVTSGLLGERTHTPLLASLPRALFRRALEAWVSRPPERASQWLDAQELAPMLDAGDIDLVIGLVRHADKVSAEDFVRHVWRLAPGQAETAALEALHVEEAAAETWFHCAPRAFLPRLADAIEASRKAPSWLASWAYARALDAGPAQERFFRWSRRSAQ